MIFDEAHHLSRTRSGRKTTTTQNYRLAEALRNHSRDLLFLSATPHQGNAFQFWSLVQLLDDQLFATPEAIADHRGLLNHVMIRRTKREVTDAHGDPIFRRRQVHTERFSLGPRERMFYDRISEYLREGYDAAGIGEARTTRKQRAIGFVMATFQKIMSSSPRAIRQALRRRLLVLLTRRQLALEARRTRGRAAGESGLAEEIMRIRDEMLMVARAVLGEDTAADSDAEAYVARIRRRLQRREEEVETTSWALDGDEEADEGIYAETDIPEEIPTVRQLIELVPRGPDRRFETLVRAVSDLSRENPEERFVVFTQYRDTLAFIAEELGRIFGAKRIATLKGGPIDDKIAAMEDFWRDDGARFLLSTSAGGEGINLQIGRILFNYDLPWNPMAVEQRIGRIHRYGQQETVQVYNLLAARYLVRYENDAGRPGHPDRHPEGEAGRQGRARRTDRVDRQRHWARWIEEFGSATRYWCGRQSFRGDEEQHDSRMDTGSLPQSAGDEPASPTSPTRRGFCRFSFFSAAQVIELLESGARNRPRSCL